MSTTIQNLANLIRAKQEDGNRFVVMLGAGASVGAGVPYMSELMQLILDEYAQGGQGDVSERFDRFWEHADKSTRNSILRKHLDVLPSEGHRSLARLIKDGYFDTVVTFNYDDLLEKALDELDVRHKVCVRGELQDEIFADYMLDDKLGPRILKIHGSFKGAKIYLASLQEMGSYPPDISREFKRLSKLDLLVCGYSFGDLCVARSFAEYDDTAGLIFCADPQGASRDLKQLAMRRLVKEQVIDGDAGKFDEFFPELERALSRHRATPADDNIPEHNPFKFIEGLYGADRDMLIGRETTLGEAVKRIESGNCHFINIYGEKKSGKSSFVRAGLMPALTEKGYEVIYLRCLPSNDKPLVGMLAKYPSLKTPVTELADAIGELKPERRERLVIVLDQFERAVKCFIDEHGEDSFVAFYDHLYIASKNIASLIVVTRDERTPMHTINTPTYIIKLIERHRDDRNLVDARVEVRDLQGEDVAKVLATLNAEAADAIPEEIRQKYAQRTVEDDDFTLAHAHSLCHLFVSEFMRKGQAPDDADKRDVESKLNLAINACDVMNLIDDLSLKEERILLRNLMKIVSDDSRERIAMHVRDSLYQLLTTPGYTVSVNTQAVN